MPTRIIQGDALAALKTIPDNTIHCCVTSPPYWGLRDYGVPGQIGLEATPVEYVERMVEIFREVRRVIRGTLWLNLGDSYAAGGQNSGSRPEDLTDKQRSNAGCRYERRIAPAGLKPKDLVGIPWRVAFALQQPYYTGRIKRVEDRIWLAAMIDTEGCMFIHKRKAGQSNGQGYERQNDNYGPGLEVANTSQAVVQRCLEIAGAGSICTQGPTENQRRKQVLYRWNLRTTECRDIVREVYPFLVAKQQQARILCGCPSSGNDAEAAHTALIGLHRGIQTDIDFAAPASMFEPGFYLRSDVIWSKSNPMPESVTDRPTKAHEYIFLLAKAERYYYDAEAIKEPAICGDPRKPYAPGQVDARGNGHDRNGGKIRPSVARGGFHGKTEALADEGRNSFRAIEDWRNKRSVWTVATQPFPEAHFATFPEELIRPCILAGCPHGGTVIDPFAGSGTTGVVALGLGREFLGIELNPAYCEMAQRRIESCSPLFHHVTIDQP